MSGQVNESRSSSVQLRPIAASDLRPVAEFLHRFHGDDVSASRWLSALEVPWVSAQPNRGFMLVRGEEIVGVYVAYYSEQTGGERFCNLGTWCVEPKYRGHGLRLLKALLAQREYCFTDMTPIERVAALNAKLGFRPLDTRTVVVPGLPLRFPSRRVSVSSDPTQIEQALDGRDLTVYRDHAQAPGALHALADGDEGSCHVIARKERWKGLPVLRLLHVSDAASFRCYAGPLGRHLLARHRALALTVERAVVDYRPRVSVPLRTPQPRMCRGEESSLRDVSYLYTELVCLSW